MGSIPVERVMIALNSALRSSTGKGTNGPYTAEVRGKSSTKLKHYGTLIYHSEGNRVVYLGGYSASDLGAINTALHWDGIPKKATRSAAVGKRMKATAINGWYLY